MIAYWLGTFVGGVLIVWLVTLVLGFFALKNSEPEPRAGILSLIAYLIVATLHGFGGADGGPYYWQAFFILIPSALVVWRLYLAQLRKTYIPDTQFEE